MLNPNQLFVVTAISRQTISEAINEILEMHGMDERLTDGDDRLTDEFCKEYADKIGELEGESAINEWSTDHFDDELAEAQFDLINQKLGITIEIPAPHATNPDDPDGLWPLEVE